VARGAARLAREVEAEPDDDDTTDRIAPAE
jgi:hypothetical protein